MPLIGYARISTEDQTALPQVQELRSAGCVEIVEEQASGGSRTRPVLARVLDQLRVGDTLVVVRIDRGRVSEVVEIVWRRNLRVNQHPPNRRRQPPGRSRHEAEYR